MADQKLWLCGMIRGNRDILEKTIGNVLKYFHGCIFVVDSRIKKEDLNWLNSIKGDGEIIVKKWVNDHSHTSNEVLLSGKMGSHDYFVWIDETDQLNENFVKGLSSSIAYLDKNNVGIMYIDRPFVVRFNDGLRFVGSPHWGITNVIGDSINYTELSDYRKENFVINNRNLEKSAFIHPSKYWFEYPNFSNHTQLVYAQFGQNVYSGHENLRINFRNYCSEILKIELTIDGLIKYMKENVGKYPDQFENILEIEIALKDIFRLLILERPTQELIENRFNWSYFKWKNEGKVIQGKNDGYIGAFNHYKKSKGESPE